MNAVLQRIGPFAVAVLWFGMAANLYVRFRAKQVVYLRRFPPIDRYQTLDTFVFGVGHPKGAYGRLMKTMRQRQDDPEVEQLRREMWRSYRLAALWALGFPFIVIVASIVLTLAGFAR